MKQFMIDKNMKNIELNLANRDHHLNIWIKAY